MRATQSREKLRDMLGAEIVAEKHTSVPKQFVADFETVAARYNLRELGEYDEARAAARRDIENAEVCFTAMALETA